MYYKEEFINGVLMCKWRPGAEWEPVSTANLNRKLQEVQRERDELKELNICLNVLGKEALEDLNHFLAVQKPESVTGCYTVDGQSAHEFLGVLDLGITKKHIAELQAKAVEEFVNQIPWGEVVDCDLSEVMEDYATTLRNQAGERG